MFGIPIWALQLIVVGLKAIGATTWAQNIEAKIALTVVKAVEDTKTYPEYPDEIHKDGV